MKKFTPLAVILAILGLIVFAINNKPAPKTAHDHSHASDKTSDPQTGDKPLIVVTPWEITSTDPSKSGFLFQRLNIAETLVNADDNATLTEALATKWTANDTATEWTFTLRENVKFHDGTPFTADNVVQSLTIALTKPTALEQAHIDKIEKVDDLTVKFTLKNPLPAFPAFLAHSTAIILGTGAFDKNGTVVELIGTGAYKATHIEPPQKLTQTAFADYWGQKASIQNIEYLANSRSETRSLLVQSADNYLVYNLDAASLEKLKADTAVVVDTKPIARTIQYKVNAKYGLFSDVKARQILSKAIDRQGISQSMLKIDNGMASELLPPMFKDWRIGASDVKPDYTTLKGELVALGFGYNDKNELTDKDGKPVKFTLRTFSDRPELPIVATALQNQWGQLGIGVEVAVGNFADIPRTHQDGTLQMALYARNYGLIPDPLGALAEDYSPKGGDWGAMNWANNTLTESLATLSSTNDPATAQSAKQAIAQVLYDERPVTPVVYYQQQVAYNKALKGVKVDALERSFYLNELSW